MPNIVEVTNLGWRDHIIIIMLLFSTELPVWEKNRRKWPAEFGVTRSSLSPYMSQKLKQVINKKLCDQIITVMLSVMTMLCDKQRRKGQT